MPGDHAVRGFTPREPNVDCDRVATSRIWNPLRAHSALTSIRATNQYVLKEIRQPHLCPGAAHDYSDRLLVISDIVTLVEATDPASDRCSSYKKRGVR